METGYVLVLRSKGGEISSKLELTEGATAHSLDKTLCSVRVRTHCKRVAWRLAEKQVHDGSAILTNKKKLTQAAALTPSPSKMRGLRSLRRPG